MPNLNKRSHSHMIERNKAIDRSLLAASYIHSTVFFFPPPTLFQTTLP
jgi:hypothetical protein